MLCPLKYSPVLGVLSQRKLRNHKRPLIKKQRGKALPKPGRKMSLFCIATCHRAGAEIADKYTKVVRLQTCQVALYRKDHKFTLQVSDRAGNTSLLILSLRIYSTLTLLSLLACFAEDGSTSMAQGKKDALFPSHLYCRMRLTFNFFTN